MKRIDLVQGSPEWLAWRKEGVGASDIPVIMGVSPYTTIEQLKAQKWGGKASYTTKAMQRGHDLEPACREEMCKELLLPMQPICAEHSEYPLIRASADAWNEEHNVGGEIKNWNHKRYDDFVIHGIPKDAWWQVQALMEVFGTTFWYFQANCGPIDDDDGNEIVPARSSMVRVHRDPDAAEQLKSAALAFLASRIDYNPPTLPDIATVQDNELEVMLARAVGISSMKRDLEAEEKAIKVRISEMGYTESVQCGAFVAKWNEGRNTIDYKAAPQLRGVDMTPYTRKGAGYWSIS